jgi:hypothetical protein
MALFENGNAPDKPIGSEVQVETLPAIFPAQQIGEDDATYAARVAAWGARTRTITYTSPAGVKQTTGAIAFNATAATIETAMVALLGAGNINVSGAGNKFTYSFSGALANTGMPRMYSTEVANGITNYFETLVKGYSVAVQESIRQQNTTDALSAIGINGGTLDGALQPKPKDIGDPARYAGGGRQYEETITATGGTRTLTVNGQTTAALAFDATATTIQAALVALSNVAPGDVTVTPIGTGLFRYSFAGALGGSGVAVLSVTPTSLTGGTSVVRLSKEGSTIVPQFV